jgi:glucose-1-phosphate thymidylyltransferase
LLAEDFVGDENFAVILGDNIFSTDVRKPNQDVAIILKRVSNPRRFGVWDDQERKIIEKPEDPPTDKAVLGLYFYNKKVFDFIKTLKPSARGELEITDVNNWYLENENVDIIEYDGFWSDAGTFESLQSAANFLSSSY